MAGFMTKLQGYVYEGECVNGTAAGVKNGTIVKLGTSTNIGKMVAVGTADANAKFLCKEVTEIYRGTVAYRFVVQAIPATANYYFVENGFSEYNDAVAYDLRDYETAVGDYLRAHPLIVGEEFVTNMVTGTIAAGTEYTLLADGTIGTAG